MESFSDWSGLLLISLKSLNCAVGYNPSGIY
uniref:Uncharacterized protein n=1 Tax=Anguilla anguilla TaxID=7936 RepID=A0A0E9VRP7_ANGAN